MAEGYGYSTIWAEENADANTSTNGGYQFSFGNGDNTGQGNGVVLPWAMQLVGLSLDIENAVNVTVEVRATDSVGGVTTSVLKTISSGGSRAAFDDFRDAPIDIPAGRTVGFRTSVGNTNSNGVRVMAILRFPHNGG